MKVGKLRVLCRYWPVMGPQGHSMWIRKCGCSLISGAILIFFSFALSNAASPTIIMILRVGTALLFVCYWLLCFSNPGIPVKILDHAKRISQGATVEEMKEE